MSTQVQCPNDGGYKVHDVETYIDPVSNKERRMPDSDLFSILFYHHSSLGYAHAVQSFLLLVLLSLPWEHYCNL